ncbi:EAL domain-containing protein [Rhizobium sp. ARZ01]|uniref:putative bifunctional diguanylate cyclase/phosphodiesterase n=1 Tax=Rhizobium sp. ARZ01 TaxID=2769313 RepID=UPI001784FD5F|nr:EAL domain-containing protein [Rhizobium sp. ARZ01]MBD9373044.1 EAL domain-containing protein [Rhizobium sp. ARZ01]
MKRFDAVLRSSIALLRTKGHFLLTFGITAGVVVALALADQQNRQLQEEYSRSSVTRQLSLLRARLEGNIQGDIKLVQGLVAALSTEPDMDQDRFADLARRTLSGESRIRNIAVAPDLVVSRIYPVKGNEKSLGLDYRRNQAQNVAALRARDTERMVLTGPVKLVQGGRGLIARYPIFRDNTDKKQRFWGIVSAVVDLEKLIHSAGLRAADLPIDVALATISPTGKLAEPFMGQAETLVNDPVRMTINLGSGERWVLAAVPKAGCEKSLWPFRIRLFGLGIVIVAPVLWSCCLMRERQRHIVELETARRAMEHNSLHDTLTGLANRRYLDQVLERLDPIEAPLTILHIDLDRFKEINDTLGHAAGDEILRRSADVLRAQIGNGDLIARIGGDEFVIVSTEDRDLRGHLSLAEQIVREMSQPILLDNHECRIGASVGVASRASSDEATKQLLINADLALYEAKRNGRNRVEYFNETLRLNTVRIKQTGDEILRALERGEFTAYYHPQFDASTFEITGVEALARWNHPSRGVLAPDAFLSIAENLNVVAAIDDTVLRHAMLQFTRWSASDFGIPKVSVNVSAQRLRDETLLDTLRGLAPRAGTLSFELLESISFDTADDQLRHTIDKIQALGIDIEIDDFGTGYASIVSLMDLSPRRLKIDRRLVMPILESYSQQRLISSIIDIGRHRGIEIVAEGAETLMHAKLLRDLGCQVLQGFAFARPMSADDFMTFVRDRHWLALQQRA